MAKTPPNYLLVNTWRCSCMYLGHNMEVVCPAFLSDFYYLYCFSYGSSDSQPHVQTAFGFFFVYLWNPSQGPGIVRF